jgi:hypothetical protein
VPTTLAGDDIDNTNDLAAVEASIQIDFFMCHTADNHALLLLKYVKCEASFALFLQCKRWMPSNNFYSTILDQ